MQMCSVRMERAVKNVVFSEETEVSMKTSQTASQNVAMILTDRQSYCSHGWSTMVEWLHYTYIYK